MPEGEPRPAPENSAHNVLPWFRYPLASCTSAELASVSRNMGSITRIVDKSNQHSANQHWTRSTGIDRKSRKGSVSSLQPWAASMPARTELGQPIHFLSNPQTWATYGDARIEEWDDFRYIRYIPYEKTGFHRRLFCLL